MASVSERDRKWRASLRVYAQAGDYTVWSAGYRARHADRMFYVFPASVTADQITTNAMRPIIVARLYKELLAKWNDPATWASR